MISRIRRFWWVFTMMHKIAFTLSLEMLKRKGVRNWVERRATGIIDIPYCALIFTVVFIMPDPPNRYHHIILFTLIGWALIGMGIAVPYQISHIKTCAEAKKEINGRFGYWKRRIAAYLAIIAATIILVCLTA